MKIVFVAPGNIEIPPISWGALERVLYRQSVELKKLGQDGHIINEKDINDTLNKTRQLNADVVHFHLGKHYECLPHIHGCIKIITNHNGLFVYNTQFHEAIARKFNYDCNFFLLTTWEKDLYQKIGFPKQNIKILPNGVDVEEFSFKTKPENNKTICLGRIDKEKRKRQGFLQRLLCNIDFVGNCEDDNFYRSDSNYLGSWSESQVKEKLTNYVNLVLLSAAELQPLVCLEAMSAGLGLVISEACVQNLDLSKKYITVIPKDKENDEDYIKDQISKNREYCLSLDRTEIREYAKTFNWENIAKKYENYIHDLRDK